MTKYQVDQDKQYFYVGTYSNAQEPAIYVCSLDRLSGEMTTEQSISGIDSPSFIVLNEDESRLYAASEGAEEVAAYVIDPQERTLSELKRASTGGESPCYVALTSEGYLLSVNYMGGQVNSFALDDQGDIAERTSQVLHIGHGQREDRQEAAHPHSIVPDRHGRYAYVSDLGLDQIVVYRLEEGKLVTHREIQLPPGAGPRHFVIHPSLQWAYGINELNETITAYAFNEVHGILEILQHVKTLPEGFAEENTNADIHISACGRFLYGSNRGHDSIVRFLVDEETGLLGSPVWISSGGKTPRNFALLDSGYLLAANQDSNNIVSFKIDHESGTLQTTGHSLTINKPVCIQSMTKHV